MAKNTSAAVQRLAKLNAVLDGAKSMLIVMQDNPDPDAIAAAGALRLIANELHGIVCSLAHGGTVGRAENLALLHYLRLNTRPLTSIDPARFDRLAMVDAQPGAGNVSLDPAFQLDIVIDHHPVRKQSRASTFSDIRRHYGAASAMLYQYLQAAEIAIPPTLATALVHGIRSDTQDLGRDSTQADIDAFLDLYPLANPRALGRIVAATLPWAYFSNLRRALDSAMVYGQRVVCNLDRMDSQDMIAEVADLLLRAERMSWCMCFGVVDECLHISLRSTAHEPQAGAVAQKLAGRRGSGGGRRMLAAVQIPLKADERDPRRLEELIESTVQRFLRATGSARDSAEALCPRRCK